MSFADRKDERGIKSSYLTVFVVVTINFWIVKALNTCNVNPDYYYGESIGPCELFGNVVKGITLINILYAVYLLIRDLRSNKSRIPASLDAFIKMLIKGVFRFKDGLILSKRYLRINRKYILVQILGMVIATIIISQSFLLSSTYINFKFDETYSENAPPAIINTVYHPSFDEIQDIKDLVSKDVGYAFTKNGFEVSKYVEDTSIPIPILTGEYTEEIYDQGIQIIDYKAISVNFKSFSKEKYETLLQIPSFKKSGIPYSSDSSYLILDPWRSSLKENFIENLLENKSLNILLEDSIRLLNSSSVMNMTIDVDYIWRITEDDYNYYYQKTDSQSNEYDFNLDNMLRYGFSFYQNRKDFEIMTKNIIETNNSTRILEYTTSFIYFVSLDDVDARDIENLIDRLSKLGLAVSAGLNSLQYKYYSYWSESPLFYSILNYKNSINTMRSMLLLVSLPIIGLAVFLVNFSLTLAEQRKRKIILNTKMRGGSHLQMRGLLFSEVITGGAIALITGMILSIPWTLYFITNSELLDANFSFDLIVIPEDWYWRLPLISILLTLDLNIYSIMGLTRVKVEEIEDLEEKQKPFWMRLYLDVILFGISMIFWIAIRFVNLNEGFFVELIFFFGPISLLALLISSPMVLSRYFPVFVEKLSQFLWNINGGVIALATRNIRKNKFSSSRLVALLMLGIMLSMMVIIIPTTFEKYSVIEANYNLGSDIVISGIDIDNKTQMEKLNVEGVEAYTEVVFTTINNPDAQQDYWWGDGIAQYYYIMGINTTTFKDAAFWDTEYSENSLDEIIKSIDENNSIGMQVDELDAMGLSKGETLPLKYGESDNETLSFNITTSYKYLPNHVTSIPYKDSFSNRYYFSSLSILSNIDTAKIIGELVGILNYQVYVKAEIGSNITSIVENLKVEFENTTSVTINSVDEYLDSFYSTLEAEIIFTVFDTMLYLTIMTAIIAISYFSFSTYSERRKEMGIYRVIGMIRKQIFSLILFEGAIILLIAMFFGSIMGVFLATNFSYIFRYEALFNPPPMKVTIPWIDTVRFLTLMGLYVILASAIPAQLTSNNQTGNLLRTE